MLNKRTEVSGLFYVVLKKDSLFFQATVKVRIIYAVVPLYIIILAFTSAFFLR
jgi:hypothetical protein